eukprot:TRINITY_DN58744_c0_g1_i1.p1 TRINITY_DN58744_c0_g1~~TRINITY_DN58744_c0_g1_i1.p1  ORF type:complete len:460 (-),score=27.12 TRINITY_DN58744_c0_g1_i1:79-1458(-)
MLAVQRQRYTLAIIFLFVACVMYVKSIQRNTTSQAETPSSQSAAVATVSNTDSNTADTHDRPPFVTGSWTPAMVETQLRLLGGLAKTNAKSKAAGPMLEKHRVMQRNLRALKQCDDKQTVPWTHKELIDALKYFLHEVYPRRPLKANGGGMRMSHSFGLWFVVRWYQPAYVIENGVRHGHTTFLLRNASPNATIYSFDPGAATIPVYIDPTAHYFLDASVKTSDELHKVRSQLPPSAQPWRDFTDVNWSSLIPTEEDRRNRTIILFDDHQDQLLRVLAAKQRGFTKLFFDDNWIPLTGDCYSVKQVCDESGGLALRNPTWPRVVLRLGDFHKNDTVITLQEHLDNRELLLKLTKVYYECPGVLHSPGQLMWPGFPVGFREHEWKGAKNGIHEFGEPDAGDSAGGLTKVKFPPRELLDTWEMTYAVPPVVQNEQLYKELKLQSYHPGEFGYTGACYVELH